MFGLSLSPEVRDTHDQAAPYLSLSPSLNLVSSLTSLLAGCRMEKLSLYILKAV
jgi:hypothetical protein